jgi:protein-S-isoprenylcysteine O-methyltransferase Ste14
LPWSVVALGYALFAASMALGTWAQAVNKFFEPSVRIQTDRGHKVVDSGPYGWVRHPGYVSALLMFPAMALTLGSLWALVPAALAGLVVIVRTRWEDQTLHAELAGYREYAQRVRYRLLPGVW